MAVTAPIRPQTFHAPVAVARAGRSARHEIVDDPRSRGDARVGETIYLALTAGIGLIALAAIVLPTATAPFGPIDDHEIVAFSRGEPPTFLEAGRFRPLYWLLRLAEVRVWGTNPAGWGFDRVVLGAVAVLLTYSIARRYAAPLVAALAGLLVVAGPWAEAWYRFGPQESYGVAMLLGAAWLVLSGRPRIGLALAVAAAFTKEPFVLASAAVAALAWSRGYRREAAIAAIPVILAGAWVVSLTTPDALANRPLTEPRYWLPWILVPIGLAVLAARRWRVVAIGMAAACGLGLAIAVMGSQRWAAQDRQWAADLAALDLPPTFIVRASTAEYELALTFRRWFPEGTAMLEVEQGAGSLWANMDRVSREGGRGYVPLRLGYPVVVIEGLRVTQ